MLMATIFAFSLNLVSGVVNTIIGIQGNSRSNTLFAMLSWFLTGVFLAVLVQEVRL